jgi:Contractile injection system tube protein
MSMQLGKFVLTNLEGPGGFVFSRFPAGVETSGRVNWQPQETTIGVKPLFYANREAKQTRLDDLWLDNTDNNDSVTPDIEALYRLMEELPDKGRPPVLLASWGDRTERCVMQDLTVAEQLFLTDGTPIRARVSITLVQFQEETPVVKPRVRENEESSFTF